MPDLIKNQLEKRWSRIFENLFDELYLFRADNLKFILVSKGAQNNLDYTIEELTRMTPVDIKPELTEQQFEKLIAPLRKGEQELLVFETVHQRRNGSLYNVEIRLQLAAEESPPIFIAIILDITVRRQAEIAFRESQQRYQALAKAAPVGIFRTDLEGHCVYVNECWQELAGMKMAQALGEGWVAALHKDDQQRVLNEWYQAAQAQRSFRTECRYQQPDGKILWLLVQAEAEKDASDRVIGYVGTATDISARKQIEINVANQRDMLEDLVVERTVELSRSNQELESFSYSVSHDLRTPLRAIDGFSLALLEDYGDQLDSTGQNYLHRVRAASQRMGDLIDALLTLSRVSRYNLERKSVDFSQLARDVVTELQEDSHDRQVEIRIADNLQVEGDIHLLRILLENLFSNAWKYTATIEHAQIEFSRRQENGETIYFIRDNGVGFDMRYVDKLFCAFQRLHGTEFEGTGIGLATVQRVVQHHGGRAWAEGQIGNGATFYFTL
ncbi:diguanylate cyclase/phosphodiesterase (GGDEF & EAL domains) with PAS/PAC sensor(s) [hydrothermal vent metagenome]|uniref:histidine kinase n=1 Tax=hydrothermal vent metagenome TaxID=652676 RepID=A0A3B1B6L4_9ZZZZ